MSEADKYTVYIDKRFEPIKVDTSLIDEPKSAKVSNESNNDSVNDNKETETLKNDDMRTTFQNPDPSDMKFEMAENKKIWVSLEAIPIYKLSNNVRAQSAFIDKSTVTPNQGVEDALAVTLKGAERYTFKFLCQQELIETIQHDWQAYDSVAQNLQQMYASIGIQVPEVLQGLFPSLRSGSFKKFLVNGKINMQALQAELKTKGFLNTLKNEASTAAKSGHVANFRVDTPLTYKGSQRRTWEFMFSLINIKQGKNHANVVLPVKLLEMLSSPSYGTNPVASANVDIILPYLFTIKTTPGNLIVCDLAVLTSVNPTWKGPWFSGYPSRCELRLSFMEYRPLEQRVFYGSTESKISTAQNDRAIKYNNQPEEIAKRAEEAKKTGNTNT